MVHYAFATQEQRELADNARKIMEKELPPERRAQLDREGRFPMDVLKKLAEAGYFGMEIPEEYGGLGFDVKTRSIILEEMAQVDAGFSFSFEGASKIENLLRTNLPREEKQMWLDRTLAGDCIGAFAMTEPNAGSDAAAIRTTAVKDGDEYILNGTKCFITNGPICDYVMVVAITDKEKGPRGGFSMFMVERGTPGFTVSKHEDKMGIRLSETAELVFDNCRIPASHLVGKEGDGFGASMDELAAVRVTCMINALGIAQAALDYAVKYAKERRTFGKRIIDHQGLGFLIAEMQTKVDAMRALVYYGIDMIDQGIPLGTISSATKIFVSETAMQVCVDAVQILGGYGYMRDYPVEKLMRDIKIFSIFDGTNQIQRQILQKMLAGKDPMRVRK